MTVEEMVTTLIDKGYGAGYARAAALHDFPYFEGDGMNFKTNECSVCRGWFTDLQMKYHYHPCE